MSDALDPEVAEALVDEPWLAGFVGPGDNLVAVRERYTGAQRTFTRHQSVHARARRETPAPMTSLDTHPVALS